MGVRFSFENRNSFNHITGFRQDCKRFYFFENPKQNNMKYCKKTAYHHFPFSTNLRSKRYFQDQEKRIIKSRRL